MSMVTMLRLQHETMCRSLLFSLPPFRSVSLLPCLVSCLSLTPLHLLSPARSILEFAPPPSFPRIDKAPNLCHSPVTRVRPMCRIFVELLLVLLHFKTVCLLSLSVSEDGKFTWWTEYYSVLEQMRNCTTPCGFMFSCTQIERFLRKRIRTLTRTCRCLYKAKAVECLFRGGVSFVH